MPTASKALRHQHERAVDRVGLAAGEVGRGVLATIGEHAVEAREVRERSAHGRKGPSFEAWSGVPSSVRRRPTAATSGWPSTRCEQGPESVRAESRVRVEDEDVRRGSFAGRLIRRARTRLSGLAMSRASGNSRATASAVPSRRTRCPRRRCSATPRPSRRAMRDNGAQGPSGGRSQLPRRCPKARNSR